MPEPQPAWAKHVPKIEDVKNLGDELAERANKISNELNLREKAQMLCF